MISDTYLPWLICSVCILVFVFIGLFAGRGVDRKSDAFLTSGKQFGAFTLAFSQFATGNTGFMFVGAIGIGYAQGVAALWVPVAWFFGDLMFWQLLALRYHEEFTNRQPLSIPDYISRVVDKSERRQVRKVAGAVIFIAILPYIIGQNIAAGKALSSITDIEPRTGVIIAGGFVTLMALVYCLRGGLRSSITTNTIQGVFIFIVGLFLAGVVGAQLMATGDPVGSLLAANPQALNLFAIHPPLLVTVFALGAATAAFGSSSSLPTLLTRLGVTDTPRNVIRAKWSGLAIAYFFWAVMVVMGLMLSGVLPGLEDPEQSLFIFAEGVSPWILGLALGGLSGLILSTVDASTMVGGSALSDDIADARSVASPVRRRNIRIFGLAAFGGSAFSLAVILSGSSVYEIVLFGVSALAGGVGPAVIISTLKWRSSANALIATIVAGTVVAFAWAALGLSAYVAEALPSFIAGFFCHWVVTRHSTKKAAQPVQ